MKKPTKVRATGLGHPEGPYELDDGRVIYANTYASEIGFWDPKTGKAGPVRLCRRRAERLHARHRRRRLFDPDAECRRVGRAGASAAVDPEDAARTARSRSWSPRPTARNSTGRTTSPSAPTAGSTSPIPATGTRPTSRIPAASSCIEKDGTAKILEELDYVYPNGIVAEPDGSIVWVESYTLRVVRRTPDGKKTVIHTLARRPYSGRLEDRRATAISGSPRSPPAASTTSARTARRSTSSRSAAPSSTAPSARAASCSAATWARSTRRARR